MEKLQKSLFDTYKMGKHLLSSRIAMAALTRMRADPTTGIPNELHVKYYSERAEDAAFVLTECTGISKLGNCFPGACGIYTKEQIEGWKKVTDAVHEKKGIIFIQMWHCGRSAHESIIGGKPIAPSSIRNRHKARVKNGEMVDCSEPEELSNEDVKKVIAEFEQAAKNAKLAGFDGVELHGANGYLVDEFLRDASNKRTDEYGGSIENRCRFALEIIDKLVEVFGSDSVGIKLSPGGRLNDMFDSNPMELCKYLLQQLAKRRIAFVEIMQPPDFRKVDSLYNITGEEQLPDIFKQFKEFLKYEFKDKDGNIIEEFKPALVANNNLDYEKADKLYQDGYCDMVSFGRNFISNPDLVTRLKNGYELTPPDYNTFYTPGSEGYTTYEKYKKTKF